MGEVDHVEGSEKKAEPHGNEGIVTPQEQGVNDLLNELGQGCSLLNERKGFIRLMWTNPLPCIGFG
jgi:hypothetical protein